MLAVCLIPRLALAQEVPDPSEVAEAAAQDEVADAEDDDGPQRVWRDEWGSAGWPNYVMMGGALGVTLGNILIAADEERPSIWETDLDEATRNALRLPVEQQRLVIRDFSDGLLTLMTSTPILFDALILAAWSHEDEEAAIQMILIHAEVITVTLSLQTFANVVVSRERPYGRTCGGPGPEDFDDDVFFCDSPDRYYSFFSGHTSQAFASAAVLCSFHMNMPLLGDGPENSVLPCVAGFTLAAATGAFRILGDMHYLTDVLTGAAVGTLTGFLIPWLLHFDPRSPEDRAAFSIMPTANGVTAMGAF